MKIIFIGDTSHSYSKDTCHIHVRALKTKTRISIFLIFFSLTWFLAFNFCFMYDVSLLIARLIIKAIMSSKVIGYWMSEKKRQKLNWSEFRNVCAKHGYDLIKLDLTKPLDDQGPFSIILHKLTDIIVQANGGDEKASHMIAQVEQYLLEHPEVAIIDPLDNVRQLLDRYRSYSVIDGSSDLTDSSVFTPPFSEITSNDVEENVATLKRAGVTFPFVCKPSVAHGSSEAHRMCVIFNENGVKDCKPPAVAQSFINHNAVLYKIFCIGDKYVVVERPSLKNFYSTDTETIFFSSQDVSKSDSKSSLTVLDDGDPARGLETLPLDKNRLDKIVTTLRKEIGLVLLGIDFVIENYTNRYAIIDINAYPGYDGFPNFFESLMSCIVERVESHNKTSVKSGRFCRATVLNDVQDFFATDISSGRYTRLMSKSQSNDQDDSGFDTSDSSDEKKKQ